MHIAVWERGRMIAQRWSAFLGQLGHRGILQDLGRHVREAWLRVKPRRVPFTIGVTLVLVFVLDLVTPTPLAISMLYTIPVALTYWFPSQHLRYPTRIVLALAVSATLVGLAFGASGQHGPTLAPHLKGNPIDMLNRVFGVLSQIAVAWVTIRFRLLRAAQAQMNHKLETAVESAHEFVGIASHELKGPLTGARGYTQLLLRRAKRGQLSGIEGGGSEALATIDDMLTRLNLLLDDLLHLARLQDGHFSVRAERLDLAGLAERVAQQVARQAPNHTLVVTPESAGIYGVGDTRRVEEVLGNLLSNAVKYSPDGGLVEVTVASATHPPAAIATIPAHPQRSGSVGRWVNLPFWPGRSRVRVTTNEQRELGPEPENASDVIVRVRDEGMGIPAAEQARLFERFVRASNAADSRIPGTGLGLYLCRALVEAQGGRIWLDHSEQGHGTVFAFSLPAWVDEQSSFTSSKVTGDKRPTHQDPNVL